MLNTVYKRAVEQLLSVDDAIRLIIVHPNYIPQRLLLAELLHKPLVYVRFEGHGLTLAALREQLAAALLQQTGAASVAPGAWVVLDECDRGQAEALDAALPEILDAVGAGRVIALLRQPPPCVFTDEALRRRTQFVPVDEDLMLWNYARRERSGPALLEVRAPDFPASGDLARVAHAFEACRH